MGGRNTAAINMENWQNWPDMDGIRSSRLATATRNHAMEIKVDLERLRVRLKRNRDSSHPAGD
jgi:hypothetical protein